MFPVPDRRIDFKDELVVTCPKCERTATMPPTKRNNPKSPGLWCDGAYGARHLVCAMQGPKGQTYE